MRHETVDPNRSRKGSPRRSDGREITLRIGPGDVPASHESSYDIERDDGLETLAQWYIASGRVARREVVRTAVAAIVQLAQRAQAKNAAPERRSLDRIAAAFETLVLAGTLQQQLCCKIAIELTEPRGEATLPPPVNEHLVDPLVEALIIVVRVGAPTTRDSAVEGLGALLRLFERSESRLGPLTVIEDGCGDQEFNKDYRERLKRRRKLILAVAGQSTARKRFTNLMKTSLPETLEKIRARTDVTAEQRTEELQRVFYERGDFLRTLPAMDRQQRKGGLPWSATEFLQEGARVLSIGEEKDGRVLIAFARFQESVFRTIDVVLRRRGDWRPYDGVVAAAVNAIPRTLTAAAPVCNARIRATISILRTAMRLVEKTNEASDTRDALALVFAQLSSGLWSNLGIIEGCYRRLPNLVRSRKHSDLVRAALIAMLRDLRETDEGLIATHRRLAAASCFRQILMQLAESGRREQVAALLASPEEILDPGSTGTQDGISAAIIASVAFEKALLARTGAMFRDWDALNVAQQVVLTRILVIQLHTAARQSRELVRHPQLECVFTSMPTLELSDEERTSIVFDTLAGLPADAAAAADVDLHRFVEHCGRMLRATSTPGAEGLPGYVLAMVSPHASGRTADAIARELDLTLRQERRHDAHGGHAPFDFARMLYQVMLRGPHQSIFHHFIPRLKDGNDRRLVDFFARYVAVVRTACASVKDDRYDIELLLPAMKKATDELDATPSPILKKLAFTLDFYQKLAADDESIWDVLAGNKKNGGLEKLFLLQDELAGDAQVVAAPAIRREPLTPLYREHLVTIQTQVSQYLKLNVGEFDARTEAMKSARAAAAHINDALATQRGLQPPERVLLMALVQRIRDLFERTILWYCDEPRRLREADEQADKTKFWWLFASDPKAWPQLVASVESHLAQLNAAELDQEKQEEIHQYLVNEYPKGLEIWTLRGSAGKEPPQKPNQHIEFEAYYVEWMSSDLDIDSLKSTVGKEQWSGPFKAFYAIITDLRLASGLLLFPCAVAIAFHLAGWHFLEGTGFMLIGAALIGAAAWSFSVILFRIMSALRRPVAFFLKPAPDRRSYSFQSLLPRMAKLVAVPMALTVEFDHSYRFPLHGTNSVLLSLMILSFLTTRFFVGREVAPNNAYARIGKLSDAERQRVRQIVAVALSQAFAIAILFSMLFASSHVKWMEESESMLKRAAHVKAGHEHPACERYPHFLEVLPREVPFDLREALHRWGAPAWLAVRGQFMFYPTIVLTWTALGLFVGVFLEGLLKGESLREAGLHDRK